MSRTYARVYHDLVDDPKFEKVYDNDHALATWLRMLLMADATYPVSAPMPPRNPTVRLLIDCGLIVEKPGNRYQVKGLRAERERRSAASRIGAVKRWENERNANAMPSRAEQSNSKAGSAVAHSFPKNAAHMGQHQDCSVCAPLRGVA